MLRINDEAPDFTAETSQGTITSTNGSATAGPSSFPIPKTSPRSAPPNSATWPVFKPEFEKRNCKIIGLSVDPVIRHAKWAEDIEETQGHKVNYPDDRRPAARRSPSSTTCFPPKPAIPAKAAPPPTTPTVRTVFVVGPDKKIKLMLVYPMSTGRNFDEVLRVLDSMQLTAKHKVATPVNWKPGEDVIIVPAVSDEEAKQNYPDGWKTVRPYLRIVPQPK